MADPTVVTAGTNETSSEGGSDSTTSPNEATPRINNSNNAPHMQTHMTVHRRKLLHITKDGAQNQVYTVPRHIAATSKERRRKPQKSLSERAKQVDWLGVVLPCTKWMRQYNIRSNLMADVIAGLTVGVMIIPQSMSYARLA